VANGALLYEVRDHIARVTINRPERRNAMSWDVITGLRKAAADAKADDDVRVLVITGAGDRAFCAGADLTGMRGDTGFVETHDARGELARLFKEFWGLGKPTIARVRGYALAGSGLRCRATSSWPPTTRSSAPRRSTSGSGPT
jgi:enoyl-CoA hydratase/carnithine racemase